MNLSWGVVLSILTLMVNVSDSVSVGVKSGLDGGEINPWEIVSSLADRVYNEQIKETKHYQNISHLEEIEGIYRNYIHLNLHGSEEHTVVRRDLGLLDNNPFISGIVALIALDAHRFGNAPLPPVDEVQRIVQVYADSHEMNVNHETSLMLFFQQRYNKAVDFWQTYPTNIIRMFGDLANLPLPYNKVVLNVLLGPEPMPNGLAQLFTGKQIADRMRIPADFDSSSTHLCFGALLYQLKDQYPAAWTKWKNRNKNITSIYDAVKKYAYRPFSQDSDVNTIDTRSYFFLRKFLDKFHKDGIDLAIIPTWAMTIQEERMKHDNGISMPWGVNIIDMTVIANFLTGTFAALDTGLLEQDVIAKDDDLKLILDSSATLMTYFLEHNLTDRPDLSLAYYPSTMEFYWFVARGLFYMENAKHKGSLNRIPVFEKYYRGLSLVMRDEVTKYILHYLKTSDKPGLNFIDGFLGNDDVSFDGKSINRGEDRYHTTAMSANALLYTWTSYDESVKRPRWLAHTPVKVKDAVYGMSKWLLAHPFGGRMGVRNAFFSVSEKNRETIPLWFPSNRFEFLNGTKINAFDKQIPEELTIFGMEGFVTTQDYKRMLELNQFGEQVSPDFHGYNSGQGSVIFWSCDAISYASAMLTISMSESLQHLDQ